jgi:hypothetical protein
LPPRAAAAGRGALGRPLLTANVEVVTKDMLMEWGMLLAMIIVVAQLIASIAVVELLTSRLAKMESKIADLLYHAKHPSE